MHLKTVGKNTNYTYPLIKTQCYSMVYPNYALCFLNILYPAYFHVNPVYCAIIKTNAYLEWYCYNHHCVNCSPVFSLLWIRDPVQTCVLHGPLKPRAPQPPALYAPAQTHHHPGLQHGRLQWGRTCRVSHSEPHTYTNAPHGPSLSSKRYRGRHHPTDHNNHSNT